MTLKANTAQEEAIRTINGPLLVISCPGSGKTTTLVRRIRHMIEEGVDPGHILMVTFTKDAAEGMKNKYISLFGSNPGVMFQTIHALCYTILLREGVVRKTDFVNETAKMDFLLSVVRGQKVDGAYDLALAAKNGISMVKNNYLDPKKVNCQGIASELFVEIYDAYMNWCRENGYIDFDDMLLKCLELLQNNEKVRRSYQDLFQYIQCDEYQDTNYIQRDILTILAGERRNFCVVGDDDQSIYAFRGARPEIMMNFEKEFPGAKIVHMGTNYRSASSIVEVSGKLITHNRSRFKKEFVSQRGIDGARGEVICHSFDGAKTQMEYIRREIERLHREGVPYKEMAVLYRNNIQAEVPVRILSNASIPYRLTESVKTMYESFIFEDLMHYVRLSAGLASPKEMLQVLNHPNRYFKEKNFRDAEYSEQGLMNAARYIRDTAPPSEFWRWDKAREAIQDWMQAFGPGTVSFMTPPKDIFSRFIVVLDYKRYIREYAKLRNTDPEEYNELLKELREDALRFDTIGDWFCHADEMTKKIQAEVKKKDQEGVVLSTMHSSKGLEWRAVFILEADEGKSPHKKAVLPAEIEEERRLFYVAMTRAKDVLYLLYDPDKVSRFIGELYTEEKTVTERVKPKGKDYVLAPEEVPKFLPGKPVIHRTFGEGKVVRYQPGEIICLFPEGEKTFLFPETFCRGIMKYV